MYVQLHQSIGKELNNSDHMSCNTGFCKCYVLSYSSVLNISNSKSLHPKNIVLQFCGVSLVTIHTFINAYLNLYLIVPPPTLTMSRDPDATVTLHPGDPLNLTCTIQLDPAVVDSDVVVTGDLGGPGGSSTTMPVMDAAGVYRITLDIPSLLATLSDTYTCNATVMPGPGVVNVMSSSESHSSLDITVGR